MIPNQNYIVFKRERDLGMMITDAFKFIRDNWKLYFSAILKIVGPVLVIALLAMIGYLFAISDIFNNISNNSADPTRFFKNFLPWFGVIFIIYILLNTLLSMTSLFYIKSYIETKGQPVYSDIRRNIIKNLGKFIGFGFIFGIIVALGSVLCYIPGIWLWIVLSLGSAIMVFEGKSAGNAFSHSFTLIKGQWWNTFGVKIVVAILLMVLAQTFSIPTIIYQFVKMATISQEDPTQMFSLFKDPIYIILNLMSYAFQFILSSISMIVAAFIYFDLNEQKNLTGTIERIDSIGGDTYQK